jgi:T5SS/PEP-CTERM-associated repeat protein
VNDATLLLDGGTHSLGAISGVGTTEVLSGNLNAISITQASLNNAGTTEISNGGYIEAITGAGSLIISGDTLTAGSVVQGTLTISSGAKLTIAPMSGAGLAPAKVPEPNTLILLAVTAIAGVVTWQRKKK